LKAARCGIIGESMTFQNPPSEEIRALLERVKTIAVVGLSPKPERPSHRIARRLQGWGYRVIPVRPALAEALGERAYARLADLPVKPDLVDVFRAADEIGPLVDDCIALGLPAIWIQEGIVNEEAAERAKAAGMQVVMDRCIAVEYRRLIGSIQGAA
jgi:predicted CoA-binding protein